MVSFRNESMNPAGIHLPKGWKSATLGELLPPEGIVDVTKAIQEIRSNPEILIHKRLLQALEPYRAELAAKDVLCEYLAYVIEWSLYGTKL